MSYILDALRKSERQRQAGQVPTLPDLVRDPPPRRQPWFAVLVTALLIFNAAGLGYLWLKGRGKPPAAPVAAPAATVPKAPAAGSPAMAKVPPVVKGTVPQPIQAKAEGPPKPPPRPVHRADTGAAGTKRLPPSGPATPAAPSKPFRGLPEGFPPLPVPEVPPVAAVPAPPPATPGVAPPPTVPAAPPSVRGDTGDRSEPDRPGDPPFLRALPTDFRERMPPFKINLYAYSRAPAERFAIIDMKKYRVGDRIPGGALILEIRAENLVLELDGTKFRVPRL